MRLVIVGSTDYTWVANERKAVRDLIEFVLDEYMARAGSDEFVVGSGHSPDGGVDIWVEHICQARSIPFQAFPARLFVWPEYKKRNLAMAEWCSDLVRIKSPRSITYGSGWTRDRAAALGKATRQYLWNIEDRSWTMEA